MAGDLEDAIADAIADAVVRSARVPGGLAKSDASALWKAARKAGRDVAGETVTPVMAKLASLAERVEWLEEQAERTDRHGGSRA